MTHVEQEIASQPEYWRRVMESASPEGLPERGERVAVIGCGTSLYVAQAYAALREGAGHGQTDAFAASEFPVTRRYDRVLAISRSGTTTEVLTALGGCAPTPATALTGDLATPIRSAADTVVDLGFADEKSVVQTRFATTALVLLRTHLGLTPAGLPRQAERALTGELPHGAAEATQFTFLGTGWTVGLAHEAALKLRESAGAWTESYPAMEYRHGPVSVTAPGSLVWFFGEPPTGLVDQVLATGATVSVTTLDPLADLIRAQRLAVRLATARGLDPDRPRNLTRSIVLTQP
ncbi:sugar isomerase [Streptomyces sp. NPDC091371]|uniref:SIS domain-containing protein n=1 Tax=Streptomyces sp. NPDC091371 TaxID=3155303 RepID=UPI00342E7BF6